LLVADVGVIDNVGHGVLLTEGVILGVTLGVALGSNDGDGDGVGGGSQELTVLVICLQTTLLGLVVSKS
jgi:hypothetical protein